MAASGRPEPLGHWGQPDLLVIRKDGMTKGDLTMGIKTSLGGRQCECTHKTMNMGGVLELGTPVIALHFVRKSAKLVVHADAEVV